MSSPIFDMHVHTVDSPDASIPAAELVGLAVERGLAGLGFVAHVDLDPDDYCYGCFDPAGYDRSLSRAAEEAPDGFAVMKGVEVGEPHLHGRAASELVDYDSCDFVVGAMHWTRGVGLILDEGAFPGSDPLEVVEAYLAETLEMVREADMDVLAHLGMFRRGMAMAGHRTDLDEVVLWPRLCRRIMETLVERGIALEVNTAGLRRAEAVTYPTPRMLVLYRETGGELVTLASDTHSRKNLFYGLGEGLAVVRRAGLPAPCAFSGRRPVLPG